MASSSPRCVVLLTRVKLRRFCAESRRTSAPETPTAPSLNPRRKIQGIVNALPARDFCVLQTCNNTDGTSLTFPTTWWVMLISHAMVTPEHHGDILSRMCRRVTFRKCHRFISATLKDAVDSRPIPCWWDGEDLVFICTQAYNYLAASPHGLNHSCHTHIVPLMSM